MFKKYMDLAKINKIIAKQRKLAQSSPETGYSAIIAAMLENEAKGTFKSYPEYSRKVVNNFFVECVDKMRTTQIYVESSIKAGKDPMTTSNDNVILCAVIMQAAICEDWSYDDALNYLTDIDNCVKVLVNMKLLPERALDESELEIRVA